MDAAGPRIAAELRALSLGEGGIPSCGKPDSAGVDGGPRIGAYAERAVSRSELGDAEPRKSRHEEASDAAEHRDLLFQRHLREDGFDLSVGRAALYDILLSEELHPRHECRYYDEKTAHGCVSCCPVHTSGQ